MRSLDGIDASDPMFVWIARGGTTTSLLTPGSGNNMGGEAYVLKHLQYKEPSVERMVVSNFPDRD